jgi:hypothetical protein
MEPRTSVVIATKDRLPLLQRIVCSALCDPSTAEIVVIDAGSVDGTTKWFTSRPSVDVPVRVLRCDGAGPAAARQAGVELASGELVVLLDDDVLPRPGLVSGHRAALCDAPARVTIGYSPVVLPARRGAGDVASFAYARDYERRCARYELGEAPVLHNLWGGNVGLWREAALRVGLSSPPFDGPGAFHEDQDFGLRAHRAGLHGVFDRALAADHHHRRTPAAALVDAERRGTGAVRVHRLHADLIGPYDPQVVLEGLPRPVASGVRAVRRPRAARASVAGTLAGVALAGRLRRWPEQDACFKLARRVCEQRGAAAARAEARA